jgi:hypothetical protein
MGYTFEKVPEEQSHEERAAELAQLAPETLAHLARVAFAEGEAVEDEFTDMTIKLYAKSSALANLAAAGYAERADRRNMTSAEHQEAASMMQAERRKPATNPPYPGEGSRGTWHDADMIDGGERYAGQTVEDAARQKIDPKLGPDYDHVLPPVRFD